MKAKERHELKQNEFAIIAARVVDSVTKNQTKVLAGIGIVFGLLVIIGGVMLWRTYQANKAGALLGVAIGITEAQVVPPSTLPGAVQVPGTFSTEQARAEAAIQAFTDVVTTYPGTNAAREASFRLASALLAAGRAAEAEQAFVAAAGDASNSVYAMAAKLGQAEALMAVGRTDDAIKIYTELAAARDGALPVDSLLMQLARASQKAGKDAEARAAFQRVIDEFPESSYVVAARQELAVSN